MKFSFNLDLIRLYQLYKAWRIPVRIKETCPLCGGPVRWADGRAACVKENCRWVGQYPKLEEIRDE